MPRYKKSKNHMGSYHRSTGDDEALSWCIKNNMIITPRQAKWGESLWYIDIEQGVYPNRKKLGTSPEPFGPGEIWKKISEYQKYYYDKYRK
jgi:hypothetical protein